MKTLEVDKQELVKPLHNAPRPRQPSEIPQPGRTPEAEPAQEPEPNAWPQKNPETQPGKEPLTTPPSAPREIPDRPESTETDPKERPSRKDIRSRYKEYLDAIADSFTLRDNASTSAVHELRVDMKRVDALIRLIQFGGRKIPSRQLKTFRSFFRLTGKLRSAQVEFDLISQ